MLALSLGAAWVPVSVRLDDLQYRLGRLGCCSRGARSSLAKVTGKQATLLQGANTVAP